MAIADAITSFIAVKQRDWARRQRNKMLPFVMASVDLARANGEVPDINRIMEDAFARNIVPLPELK